MTTTSAEIIRSEAATATQRVAYEPAEYDSPYSHVGVRTLDRRDQLRIAQIVRDLTGCLPRASDWHEAGLYGVAPGGDNDFCAANAGIIDSTPLTYTE